MFSVFGETNIIDFLSNRKVMFDSVSVMHSVSMFCSVNWKVDPIQPMDDAFCILETFLAYAQFCNE